MLGPWRGEPLDWVGGNKKEVGSDRMVIAVPPRTRGTEERLLWYWRAGLNEREPGLGALGDLWKAQ